MKTKLLLMLLFVSSLSFSQWQFEGTSQFTNNSLDVAIAGDVNDVPYVAYSDITDGLLHVKKYDGTNWVDVGSNATGVVVPKLLSIAINPVSGHPWVAFRNNSTARVDVVKFDGTNWQVAGTSVTNYDPQHKIVLKFTPSGVGILGTQKGTDVTNSRFYVYRNVTTTYWQPEFNERIFANSFDVSSHSRIVVGFPYRFGNWRPQARVYNHNGSSWSSLYTNAITPPGGVNGYLKGLAGANNQVFYNYFEHGNKNNRMRLTGTSAQPSGGGNPTKTTYQYKYNPLNLSYYGMFFSSTQTMQVQQFKPSTNSWTNLNVGLTFTGVDPKAKLEVNNSGTKIYVAYLKNSKVSVKYFPVAAPRTVTYVDINATGNNDGSSWADAYTNLQTAIDNTSLPTKIWVAKGTYKPDGNTNTATFKIDSKSLEIYGGFSGNGSETVLSDRDIKNNITILSGDLNGDDNANINNTESTRSDNAYHVVSFKQKGTGSILDGFTISGGNANGTISNSCSTAASQQNDPRRGGAIYVQAYNAGNIKVIVKNCTLENNSASYTSVYGALNPCGQQNISVDVSFEACVIRNNYSNVESALLYVGNSGYKQYSKGVITNTLFYNNTSISGASSIYFATGTSNNGNTSGINVAVINSTFASNTGFNGSVIKMVRAANSQIKNSIIYGNGSVIPFSITTSASVVSNSIVQGGQSGGINANPMFVDAANADYQLLTGSPAINAGNNSFVPTGIVTDLLGNQRIYNTTVDLGAYENNSPINRTLTIASTNGTVSTNPNTTGGTYTDGTDVTLTATPNTGYQFNGWSGDATGTTNPLTITMDADKSVTAIFSKVQRTLTITATNGLVTTNPNPINGTYDDGTVVTLTAAANTGYGFVNWSGESTATTNSITVTMDADKTLVANFSATASVDDFDKSNFSIYPNPTSSILNIKSNIKINKLTVYNLRGQKVLESNLETINVSNLTSGIYMLQIMDEKGRTTIKKLIKK